MAIFISGGGGREVLSAARTYFVATTGSDSNDGLTSGTAFATITKALSSAAALDCGTNNCTISVADGTYTAALNLPRMLGTGTYTLQGNTTTPGNVIISTTSATAISAQNSGKWTLSGLKVQTTTSGDGINISGPTLLALNKVYFGAVASGFRQLYVQLNATAQIQADYTISGGGGYHMLAQTGGAIGSFSGLTITVSGTPAFGVAFAAADTVGAISFSGETFSGSATGTRYSATLNGVINTGGGGASYFPGDSAGSTATGGQYA